MGYPGKSDFGVGLEERLFQADPQAGRISARGEGASRWGADGGPSVGVCKPEPCCSETVEVRGSVVWTAEGTEVAVPEVISQYENNVGWCESTREHPGIQVMAVPASEVLRKSRRETVLRNDLAMLHEQAADSLRRASAFVIVVSV